MGEAKRRNEQGKSLRDFFREAVEASEDPDVREAIEPMERAALTDPEAAKHLKIIRAAATLVRGVDAALTQEA